MQYTALNTIQSLPSIQLSRTSSIECNLQQVQNLQILKDMEQKFLSDNTIEDCISPTTSVSKGNPTLSTNFCMGQKKQFVEVLDNMLTEDSMLKEQQNRQMHKKPTQIHQNANILSLIQQDQNLDCNSQQKISKQPYQHQQCQQALLTHKSKINQHLKNLYSRLNALNQTEAAKVSALLNWNMKLIQSYVRPLNQQFNQYRKELSTNMNKIETQNNFYQNNLQILQQYPRVSLVKQLGGQIKSIIQQQTKQLTTIQIPKLHIKPINFVHSSQPIFVQRVENFSEKRIDKEEIISRQFSACQSKWVLKIYPAGFIGPNSPTKMKQIQYLSIYVQMVDGLTQGHKFIVKVEVVDEHNSQKKVSKQFTAEYFRGQSWGYDRYIRISNLYKNNLISYNNSITINVQINLERYKDSINLLMKQISPKQKQVYENQRKIRKLKALLLEKKKRQQSGTRLYTTKNRFEESTNLNRSTCIDRTQRTERTERLKTIVSIPKREYKRAQISLQKPIKSKIIRLCSIKNSALFQTLSLAKKPKLKLHV